MQLDDAQRRIVGAVDAAFDAQLKVTQDPCRDFSRIADWCGIEKI